ncbi:6-pyruvoyl tetrahydrobiopterin synthase [Candidatus Kinetoplastibacterium desouzaii TCC079E]|uniref:6-carboxy-5,6,7,8-tetrahydropterin synthase n=1 Tax=Candidatus Kinetoplastidibacterium desouzai TCC079E TaxID=1208919 RepID=M1M3J4_9PROT|nr:6-carboxytetrahydropterin synthase [Candidatus Kinetoplastibacterium desouzaii]AGF46815.1 6-pyruvoyl tetrahydrobiopterin synthase [Candidatus Kinetoplastibacterium desouzaii TCC079E]
MISITRKLEFDAGHRIPNHKGECKNIHGHRYLLEITLEGDLSEYRDKSDDGMVMDFSDIKKIAIKNLVSIWDHSFFSFYKDKQILDFLNSLPNHKTVVLDKIPTVENLALIAYNTLFPFYNKIYNKNLVLKKICIYETPNCWAEYTCN